MGCIFTSFLILLCGYMSSVYPFIRVTDIWLFPFLHSFAGLMVSPRLTWWGTNRKSSRAAAPFYIPNSNRWWFQFLSTSSPALVIAWVMETVGMHRHLGSTFFGTWIHSTLAAAFCRIHCFSVVGLVIWAFVLRSNSYQRGAKCA